MKLFALSNLCFFSSLFLYRIASANADGRETEHAILPPRGWNSYDSFCWIISEQDFLQSADIVAKRLLPHGYEYVVVDYLWYRKKVKDAHIDSEGIDLIDEWGRMVPDPDRWPSSKGGKGFTEVAKKVHDMGLKFGIHVMKGISNQAVNANTLIYDYDKKGPYTEAGRQWRAQDIAIKEKPCAWMPHGFMAVNTKLGAGRAFLRSLHKQYADWSVDFVKHDCAFGDDLDEGEISVVSEVFKGEHNRPIIYSLSPGTSAAPDMAQKINGLANMYRVTGDDWDSWPDVAAHFSVARDFAAANMIGSQGLKGRSWPDLDMLPLGWLTDANSTQGPYRACKLTLDEQKTQMTLWAMAKSPLMFGGDVRKLDDTTYGLITNPTILEIDHYSSNNKDAGANATGVRSWIATGRQGEIYLAFFNLNNAKTAISAEIADLGKALPGWKLNPSCKGTEIWSGKDFGVMQKSVSTEVETHGCALFVLNCK
ncbi:hypothetical protein CISIN_1g011701mg [Citrus sinensis]|uniref:Alpha-galactosidase n=1 Tax=Citrus sinensis TaxID=2711 RepID=A0A067DPI0_CITSI|nr:hypothetical protein CISIN_1g011701mg [Citrus sinensis]